MQQPDDALPGRRWQVRVLAALAVLTLPAFVLTASVTRAYHGRVENLASDYVVRADALAADGKWAAAVDAYRAAIVLGHEPSPVRLRMAQALARAGRGEEARSYLLSLHDAAPGDALVNVELARLAAADDNADAAVRYYHDAIDGAWPEQPQRHRRETRLELAAYLARRGDAARSQAELLPLTSELPREASTRIRVARLLADTGSPEKAFAMYRAALDLEAANAEALAGAGRAAFDLTNYRTAHRYLSKALSINPADADTGARLALVDAIIGLDPFTRGLSGAERASRVSQALDLAIAQAVSCPGSVAPDRKNQDAHNRPGASRPSGAPAIAPASAAAPAASDAQRTGVPTLADLRNAQRQWRSRRAHTQDALDETMALVFAVEDRAADRCGALKGRDLALQLIGRERRASER